MDPLSPRKDPHNIFPTNYVATSPLQALKVYALDAMPGHIVNGIDERDPSITSADGQLTDGMKALKLTPNSKHTPVGRKLTSNAHTFWKGYVGDGKAPIMLIRCDAPFNLAVAKLNNALKNEVELSEATLEGLDDWNTIATLYDESRYCLMDGAVELLSQLPSLFKTYEERTAWKKAYKCILDKPCEGKELGLTRLLAQSIFSLANHFVNQKCFFRDWKSLFKRNFGSAPLAGSGTTDMCARHITFGKPEVPPVIFEHKPYLSDHDLIRLIMALDSNTVEVTYENDRPRVKHDLIGAGMEALILQIIEQLHVNRAETCILGNWDFYVVFQLSRRDRLLVSNIICRDPDMLKTRFEFDYLKQKASIEGLEDEVLLCQLKPFEHSLLHVLVALMIDHRPYQDKRAPWLNDKVTVAMEQELKAIIPSSDPLEQSSRTEGGQDVEVFGTYVSRSPTPEEATESGFSILLHPTVNAVDHNYPVPESGHKWVQGDRGIWAGLRPLKDEIDPVDGPDSTRVTRIDLIDYVDSGRCYDAYRGFAEIVPSGQDTPTKIVVVAKYIDMTAKKFADAKHERYHGFRAKCQMEFEMQMLETLRQTGVVPEFYAVAHDLDVGKWWLILEDCGTEADLSEACIRRSLTDAYDTLHTAGYLHNDVSPRHILSIDNTHIKIIDWEAAGALDWHNTEDDFNWAVQRENRKVLKLLAPYVIG